ncbi:MULTISPECIES: restriction endonuclease subunit S [unclassified Pseudomonas]|uniref:restriction endonuclease subunit S n=1 Tax=unclassified Pseudomonas TaxID=196821 RepID=UPI0012959523|nr:MULTISPECIES: restriction endonuclease subunit S [unclassified Pseudomonas]MQU52689.1 4'-phosphopantetheinyl transferase [Pseudomonas sp. FSL R10-1339]NMY56501.1 4'-phosphopantetheinyl transferase [Pseudomonas sp. WS 5051]
MSELPNGWTETTLGEVANWGSGGTPSRSESSFYGGKIPWIKSGELNGRFVTTAEEYITEAALEGSSAKLFPAGSVAIAMYGATIGKTAILGIDAATNQACAVGAPIEGLIGKELLYRLLQNEKNAFIEKGKGGAQPNISQAVIKAHLIGLPPLAEQARIVQKLDELLTQVDILKARIDAIPALLKRFRQSILTAAISGKLTKDWRTQTISNEMDDKKTGAELLASIHTRKQQWALEHSDHNESRRVLKRLTADIKLLHIPKIPKNWISAQLEDAVLMIVDCHNKTAPYSESGIPLVRTPNIRNGKFVWAELKFIDEPTYLQWSRRCPPETGDIIFTREAPMGEAAIIPKDTRLCLGQRTMLIRPLADAISAEYLLYVLMDPAFRARSEDTAVGTGVRHLRVGDVSNLLIPVPPTDEQNEIVRRVEQLFAFADNLEANVASAKNRIDHLTQSILAKAFRGELVPQDPNDEPASVLLERIKAQRAAAPKAKRSRKTSA